MDQFNVAVTMVFFPISKMILIDIDESIIHFL